MALLPWQGGAELFQLYMKVALSAMPSLLVELIFHCPRDCPSHQSCSLCFLSLTDIPELLGIDVVGTRRSESHKDPEDLKTKAPGRWPGCCRHRGSALPVHRAVSVGRIRVGANMGCGDVQLPGGGLQW